MEKLLDFYTDYLISSTSQTNHLFCSILAYVKLKTKLKTKLNHFELKAKIYIKALKAAYL